MSSRMQQLVIEDSIYFQYMAFFQLRNPHILFVLLLGFALLLLLPSLSRFGSIMERVLGQILDISLSTPRTAIEGVI